MRQLFVLLFIFFSINLCGQKPKHYSSADIEMMLNKLSVLGNVMYVAAHPDDENTRLIAYLANARQFNTYDFSCTRGDGGQNLIGPEIREELGLIRTHELLEARKCDGGKQLFSRANDFGYSKQPKETFTIWDKGQVLEDMVWAIRKYRPDVLITRFTPIPGETHGHHTASAILAEEAFDAAADPNRFPDQLKLVGTWQAKAIYWNAYWWRKSEFQKPENELIKLDVGEYNTFLGKSYTEIAAESRSMHKSQGFGSTGTRGEQLEYLQYIKGEKAGADVFENIDATWGRIKGGAEIVKLISEINGKFDTKKPYQIVDGLLGLRGAIEKLDDPFWKEMKLNEVDELIYACLGLYLEGASDDFTYMQGQGAKLNIEAINRSPIDVKLLSVKLQGADLEVAANSELPNNINKSIEANFTVPIKARISQPYWLREKGTVGMFRVDDLTERGQPYNGPEFNVTFEIEVKGHKINYTKGIVYKHNDPVEGEQYKPVYVTPKVFVNISDNVVVFANGKPKEIILKVRSGGAGQKGKVKLQLGDGWKISPGSYDFNIGPKGGEENYTFTVYPPEHASDVMAKAIVELDGEEYSSSYKEINYRHIPFLLLFPNAEARFVKIELNKKGEKLGYLMGAGDQVPDALRQIGYKVELLDAKNIDAQSLAKYDAVILGVRAFNTIEELKFKNAELFDYTKNGGTLIVQYNTSYGMVTEDIAPYELKLGRERVTEENAPIQFLDPGNPLLNEPNRITDADFDDWVQERGLYFADKWDKNTFTPLFSSKDKDEDKMLEGSTLVAPYGNGYYIYTSLSWFRELPAGVPGAYRLFANLISIGKK